MIKILGVVTWTNHDKNGNPIAGVLPLYAIEKSQWRPIDAAEEFPSQGQVFWPHATNAAEGALLFFQAEPNPGQKDQFRATDAKPAHEILDLREYGNAEEVRAALAGGIRSSGFSPARALIWSREDLLVGPVELATTPTGLLKLKVGNLSKVATYRAADPKKISDGRRERFLRIDEKAPTGYVDWDDDKAVLKRALQTAAKLSKLQGTDAANSKKGIESAVEALAAHGTGPDSQLEHYRLERALELCKEPALLSELVPEILEAIRHHPDVKARIATLEKDVRAEIEQAAKAEIEQELAKDRGAFTEIAEKKNKIQKEILKDEGKLSALREELASVSARIEDSAKEVETALRKRLGAILDAPADLLAEAALLRPFLGSGSSLEPRLEAPKSIVPSGIVWKRASPDPYKDRVSLQRALMAAARERGVSPALMSRLHAAIISRLVPVIHGPRSVNMLAAYANATCGSRMAVLHVSPASIHPHELISDAGTRGSQPSQNGLFSTAAAAKELDCPSLILFEGLNRAPIESTLLPLLQLISAGLPINTPQYSVEFGLPQGLRIVSTIVSGATTVPITSQIWSYAVALRADAEGASKTPTGTIGEIGLSNELFVPGDVPVEEVEAIVAACASCRELRPTLEQYGAGLARMFDPSQIAGHLVEDLAVPFAISSLEGEELKEALTKLEELAEKELGETVHLLTKGLK